MPTGNSQKAKTIRAREALVKDSEYQNYRVQQLYFAPFGVNTTPFSEAEANTLRLKNIVDNMSDDQVNKFERIYRSYPNQSAGFYTSLVDNKDFDVNHPEFENVASLDLEESAKKAASMLPTQVADAMMLYGDEPMVPMSGSYYSANRRNRPGSGLLLPTGNQFADTANELPAGYQDLYGTGGLQGVNEGVNNAANKVMGAADRAGEEFDFLDPLRWTARNAFGILSSPQQAVVGSMRSVAGALSEEGGPNFGKAFLGGLSATGVGGAIGNAVYGDENFDSAWEQTFAGQMLEAGGWNPKTGEGWFPGGEVAERQAKSVYQTHHLDNQVWSLGVQASHSLGMDPDTSAYHFLSGTLDFAASFLDPTIVGSKLLLPSKGLKLLGQGISKGGQAAKVITPGAGARIESITVRGGTKRAETSANVLKARNEQALKQKAYTETLAAGGSPERAAQVNRLIDHLAAVRGGKEVGPLPDEFAGDVEQAGFDGIIRAAQDEVKRYEGQKIAGLETNIRRTRKDKLAAERGLADDIQVPAELTDQASKDLYRAYTTILRNQELTDLYKTKATELVDRAAGTRRPEKEQAFVNTYITDVGEQFDLAVGKDMGDLSLKVQDPDMSDGLVTQVFEDMRETHNLEPGEASAAMEGLVQESRFGPLPESVYTIGEPVDEIAFGRVNGQDAIVNFERAKRADPGDPIVDEAQKILTTPEEADLGRVEAINDNLLERLNINPEAFKAGTLQPLDIKKDFDHPQFTPLLVDGVGNSPQGADLMAALLRLINAEPQFEYNLVHASLPVPRATVMAAGGCCWRWQKSIAKDLNGPSTST